MDDRNGDYYHREGAWGTMIGLVLLVLGLAVTAAVLWPVPFALMALAAGGLMCRRRLA